MDSKKRVGKRVALLGKEIKGRDGKGEGREMRGIGGAKQHVRGGVIPRENEKFNGLMKCEFNFF